MKKTLTGTVLAFAAVLVLSAAAVAAQQSESEAAIAKITAGSTAKVSAETTQPAKTAAQPTTTAVQSKDVHTTAAAQPKPVKTAAPAAKSVVSGEVAMSGTPAKYSEMPEGPEETAESILVTTEWLKKNLGKVILIDARPESLYTAAHIPGAINAPWTYFANTSAPSGSMKWGTIWPEVTMAKRLGALGVNGKKTVVAYSDAGDWGQGGWAVMVMRMCGIKNAKILDGGIYNWKQDGGKVTKTRASGKKTAFTVKKYTGNYTVDTGWIRNNIGKPGLFIVDVRTKAEYDGKIHPFQEKRTGRLPGAIHIDLSLFETEDGKFKSPEDIKTLMSSYNITPESEIVVYDTAGVRASFATMVLRYAGFKKSQCYDQGFQAWAGDKSLPIEK